MKRREFLGIVLPCLWTPTKKFFCFSDNEWASDGQIVHYVDVRRAEMGLRDGSMKRPFASLAEAVSYVENNYNCAQTGHTFEIESLGLEVRND